MDTISFDWALSALTCSLWLWKARRLTRAEKWSVAMLADVFRPTTWRAAAATGLVGCGGSVPFDCANSCRWLIPGFQAPERHVSAGGAGC